MTTYTTSRTTTSLASLFALLCRPLTDAVAAEREVIRRSNARRVTDLAAADQQNRERIEAMYAAPVAVVSPVVSVAAVEQIEFKVAPEVRFELATKKPATRRKAAPRAKKAPALVMAGAARKTRTTTATTTDTAVEPVPVAIAEPEPTQPARKPFTAKLPATKSSPSWSITFTPAEGATIIAGKLGISSARSDAEYTVTEFPTGWDGRGFHLAKIAGGTDGEAEGYNLFCSKNGPEADSCDCKGSSRWNHCKHRVALRTLMLNDLL